MPHSELPTMCTSTSQDITQAAADVLLGRTFAAWTVIALKEELINRSVRFRENDVKQHLFNLLNQHADQSGLHGTTEPAVPAPHVAQTAGSHQGSSSSSCNQLEIKKTDNKLKNQALREAVQELFVGNRCRLCRNSGDGRRKGLVQKIDMQYRHVRECHKELLAQKGASNGRAKMANIPVSHRCKVVFEGFSAVSPRHYLLVSREGKRFDELCAKILHDCNLLKLDQHKELASLCWKDSDDDNVNVDCEDALDAAVSYVVPDQKGFCTLRLFAKFRPRKTMGTAHPPVVSTPKAAAKPVNVEYVTIQPKEVDSGVTGHVNGEKEAADDEDFEDEVNEELPTAPTVVQARKAEPVPARLVGVPIVKTKVIKGTFGRFKHPPSKRPPGVEEPSFLCPTCQRFFPTELQLNGHLSCHSTGVAVGVTTDASSMSSSAPAPPPASTSTLCSKCGVKCRTLDSLSRHDCLRELKRRPQNQLSAKKNPKKARPLLPKSPSMAAYMDDPAFTPPSNNRRFTCELCGIKCQNAERYARHDCAESAKRRERHSRNAKFRRKIGKIVKKRDRNGDPIKRRMGNGERRAKREKLPAREPICPVCGRHLMNNSALASHMRGHSNRQESAASPNQATAAPTESSFVCEPSCGKWYASYSSLYKHRRQCDYAKAANNDTADINENGKPHENGHSHLEMETDQQHSGSEEDAAHNSAAWDTDGGVAGGDARSADSRDETSPEIEVMPRSPSNASNGSGPTTNGPQFSSMVDGPYGPFKVEVW